MLSFKGSACLFSFFTSALLVRAQPAAIHSGPWEFTFDPANGNWQTLRWQGTAVADNPGGKITAVDVQAIPGQWLGSKGDVPSRLLKQSWDPKTATLELIRRYGDWELGERVQIGSAGNPDRVARTLNLTFRPATPTSPPTKFHRVRFVTVLPKTGNYLFPGRDPFDANRTGDLTKAAKGFRTGGAGGLGPLLLEQKSDRTLLFINDARRDRASTSLSVEGESSVTVMNQFEAAGWAEPNVTQTIGTAYLDVARADQEHALSTAVWRWCDEVGIKVPADRPAWVRQVALYSFHPGGTIGSGAQDLGGFSAAKKELLPRVKQLGFGAIWVLPIEDRSMYWPRDYYKFQDGLGSAQDYRELVSEAHRLGLKVWQDNVPHGGSPAFGRQRGDKPWWLVFDEKGDALDYWCFDFREPEWQRLIARVADYYVREFGVDGFRVDAVGGSHAMNWRRAGFPPADHVPANVPAEWWRESLAAAGGPVPALPYERGSLTLREGGLQMLHAIRQAVRRHQPQTGALLGEVQGAPYMQEADVVYDFQLAHGMLLQIRQRSPGEFARGLQRFLEEQKYSEPRGTVRLRYVESHDTVRSQLWYGVDAKRALMALTAWIDGLPMIYHEADIGHGPFLQRVLAIRAALPELQTGEAFYEAVKAESAGVFTCLRTLGEKTSVAVINLNPEPCETVVTLPVERPELTKHPGWTVWNAWTGRPVAENVSRTSNQVHLRLAAWEPVLLCLRPSGTVLPVPGPLAGAAGLTDPGPASKLQLKERPNEVEVSNNRYRLLVNRRTGLLQSLMDGTGKPFLSGCELVLDAAVRDGESVLEPAQITTDRRGREDGLTVNSRAALKGGGAVTLTYPCSAGCITLDANLAPATPAQRAGLVFAAPDSDRYVVHSAEGFLTDWFQTRHTAGKPGNSSIYYRTQGTEVIWQSEMTPLPALDGHVGSWRKDGRGVYLWITEPWRENLASALLLDRFAGKPGWHAAFFWRDNTSSIPIRKPADQFTLNLLPVPGEPRPPSLPPAADGVKVSNSSLDWIIENAHYRVVLRRTGGAIRELWAKEPALRLLAKENEIYTDQGFRTEHASHAGSADDVETGVRVWREGPVVRLRFHGLLRSGDRFGIVRPPIWFDTEYAFDDSSAFGLRASVLSEGGVRDPGAFLAWKAQVPEVQRFVFRKGDRELASGVVERSRRTGETAKLPGAPLPDWIGLLGEGGAPLLTFTGLRTQGPEPLHNVFVHGQNFYLAWLDGKGQRIAPNRWHETAMTVGVGSTKAASGPAVPWLAGEGQGTAGVVNPSFEAVDARLFAASERRWITLGNTVPTGWNIPRGGSITTETAHGGLHSAKVVNTTGEYMLFQQPLADGSRLAGHKVKLSAWVKGENIKSGDASWKLGSVGLSFQTAGGKWQHGSIAAVTGTFDWRKLEGMVNVPAEATALTLRLGLNGATGTMWIDDVALELVE